jgi:hypothetical protein
MDEVTREYLDFIGKIADSTQVGLTDEVVWLEITKCLLNNSGVTANQTHNQITEVTDWYLSKFKKRFRE